MLDLKDIRNIDHYYHSQLSSNERRELERQMEIDPAFKKESIVFFHLFDGFKALEIESLNKNMNQWEIKHPKKPVNSNQTIKMNNFFKYAAAAILLLSFLPLGYQYLNGGLTSEELFADNFTTKKVIDVKSHRGFEGEDAKENIDAAEIGAVRSKAIVAYNQKNYSEATKYFKAYITTTTKAKDKAEVEFYLAVCYLADNHIPDAKKLFEKMTKKGTKNRKQDAEWYLVLTLLKENNVEQAQKNLSKILNQKKTHAHKEKALKLQQQIDKYYVQ